MEKRLLCIISIVYCTLGGLEAVAWTDTIQTFVLMGGALLSYVIIIHNLEGGFSDFFAIAASHGKFTMVNWDFSASSFTRTALWDVFMAILGLLGSSMCGLFMLGMYTRRTNGIGAVTGAFAGVIGLYFVKVYTPMHFLLYTIVGTGLCFIVGYLMSFLVGGKQKQIEGLTVYTLNR